ncbi:MAG: WD40 repeat domain-containing serine/threonine protein kinase [Phycisphaerae bacterium]
MNAKDRFQRVAALFRAARALPAAERDGYLARECAADEPILAQVRSLLLADQLPDGPLDQAALVPVASAFDAGPPTAPESPSTIGRYRILRRIGEGGMGAVFEAEQENPRRNVAVKLLQRGAASRRILRRFQQEAEILGRLQHPGIAQILEAGVTQDGPSACPYIVMELVRGASLLDHAREHRLRLHDRLALFALVCDAVHYAHQSGVVHRDLKPANILVATTAHESRAGAAAEDVFQPKVLDFGVARLVDSDVSVATLHTTVGELVGTIPYMSPEQAGGDPRTIDWRSDVYALGVILFELLTDRLPHDVSQLLAHEAVRAIREDEPSRAGSIDRALRGDVETILARALEKDKTRRYQSAGDLAADIRRYLHEQPIAARPASALYRIRKFTRRNRALVAGVVVAFLALSFGAAAALRAAIVAERARGEEQRLRAAAERQTYRACLVAASSALRYHEAADARRQLDAAPVALRGWEWRHLDSRVDDSLASLNVRFIPMRLGVSPDGQTIVCCGSSGRVHAWRGADPEPVGQIGVYELVRERRIHGLTFRDDGRTIRADTRAGSVTLALPTLQLLASDAVPTARRSPDARWGAFANETASGPQILLRGLADDGAAPTCIDLADAHQTPIRFSPDGRFVAIALEDARGVWLFRRGADAPCVRRPDLASATDLAFSADGERLAVALPSGAAHVLATHDGQDLRVLQGPASAIVTLDIAPVGERVATAAADRAVRLWSSATGDLLATMHGSAGNLSGIAFSADGKTLVTAADDRLVRWWDAGATTDPFALAAPGFVYGVAFSPDGATLTAACLDNDRPLRSWDVKSGAQTRAALDGHLSAVAYSPSGDRLAIGRSHGDVEVLSTSAAPAQRFRRGLGWRTDALMFNPAGDRLIWIGNRGELIELDLASGARLRTRKFDARDTAVGSRAALSPDGRWLAATNGAAIQLLDARDWNSVGAFEGHTGTVFALAFSADGTRLVSGANDQTLRVWDANTRAPLAVLTGHSDVVFAVAFSPDGRRIVSAGRDRVIRVWDAARYDELTQLHGHTAYVYCLAFSPDGQTLASGGGDNTVRLWTTHPYRERVRR